MSTARLERRLGYQFKDGTLLKRALTHRSSHQVVNYERLEFLGDALLGAIVAEALYQKYPHENEGRLTRLRATLVRQETLAEIAKVFQLGDYLILSTGEMKSGGHHRESILADVLEAIIGAIYLDSHDFAKVKTVVLAWLQPLLQKHAPGEALKDPKSRLQEWLQARRLPVPEYEVTRIDGDAPNQHFYVVCRVHDIPLGNTAGEGTSRRVAEQQAAERFIEQISLHPELSDMKVLTGNKGAL